MPPRGKIFTAMPAVTDDATDKYDATTFVDEFLFIPLSPELLQITSLSFTAFSAHLKIKLRDRRHANTAKLTTGIEPVIKPSLNNLTLLISDM
ncbi:hypothetical protein PROVALCAL_04081 [Providencia alcalifaciens DSM 30120]|uniref:Uncharacterized protein n=1 Tax=Providencia alcalifaciens DSM 30120 TaxID=520999 RepID=B6XL19_9GAMM|nr:hypothetical protein [Providencia alcalifaciens]EEB43915.1 hypothetical protein PROVALCAL_04081 [Providencia alcalifaciens DSM 30120]